MSSSSTRRDVGDKYMKDVTAVILAGGKSKRMMSNFPKPMHKVGGAPMVGMVYDSVIKSGVGRCVVVVGFGAEHVMQYFGDKVEYARQSEQLGTGHALLTALDYLGDYCGRVLALFGDMPLVSPDTLKALVKQNIENGEHGTLVYADFDDPFGFGRIIRDADGNFIKIIEERDASPEVKKIRDGNVGIHCFDAAAARYALGRLSTDNNQGEMYLTDMFEQIANGGMRVGLYKIGDSRECLGANDRAQLAELNRTLWREKCVELMIKSGVTITDPDASYIDRDVVIGMDTVIYPGCIIEGAVVIGEGCEIGPNSRIRGSRIGSRSKVEYSVVTDSVVGDDVSIGPYAQLRPGANIGDGTKIGDFVEIKNSNIGERVSISHHAYVGDADVGSDVNIGCGVITCNYDGKLKHRTTICDNAFIGSNVNLVAPVTINKYAYVASGSTITKDVPEDALAVARERQSVKENWVTRKGLR